MTDLVFKGKAIRTSDKDVTISVRKNNDVSFVFRNGTHKKIAPHTGHYGYAIKGSRIYFCEFSKEEGYKFSGIAQNKADNAYCHFNGDMYDDLLDFATKYSGSYELSYDATAQHWCVECNLLFKGKNGRVK